jgi:hypothetical protein
MITLQLGEIPIHKPRDNLQLPQRTDCYIFPNSNMIVDQNYRRRAVQSAWQASAIQQDLCLVRHALVQNPTKLFLGQSSEIQKIAHRGVSSTGIADWEEVFASIKTTKIEKASIKVSNTEQRKCRAYDLLIL